MKLNSVLNFADFYREVKDKSMPFKTAYKLSKIAAAVETEVEFYRTKLTEIIREYSEKDENGDPVRTEDGEGVKLQAGREVECGEKIAELQNIEIQMPMSLTIEDLESFDLTPELVAGVIPFIE